MWKVFIFGVCYCAIGLMGGCAPEQGDGSVKPSTAQAQDAQVAPVAQNTAPTAIPKEQVPTFKLRARVMTMQGKAPAEQTFTFQLGTMNKPAFAGPLRATGTAWSNQGIFSATVLEQVL